MPVNFQPASPFRGDIIRGYAESQARAQADARAQQMAMERQRLITQASIASAGNATAANNSSNAIEGQLIGQRNQIEFQKLAQMRQIEAQQYAQQQDHAFRQGMMQDQFAYADMQVSKQERDRMARMQAGLAELEDARASNIISPEEYYGAAMELKTGINFTQRRMQNEQANNQAAQARMREEETANINKTMIMSQKFQLDMAAQGVTVQPFVDPSTGRTHMVGVDPKTGRLYNPFLEHAQKDEGFSYKKALPEAKAEAEAMYPVQKNADGIDVNEELRTRHIRDAVKRMAGSANAQMPEPEQDPTDPLYGMGAEIGRSLQKSVQQATGQQQPQQAPELKQISADMRAAYNEMLPLLNQDPTAKQYVDDLYAQINEIMSSPDAYRRKAELAVIGKKLSDIYKEAKAALKGK